MNYDPHAIREEGLRILQKGLGAAGTAIFLRQFAGGSGNFTEDRGSAQAGMTIDEIAERIKRRREQDHSSRQTHE